MSCFLNQGIKSSETLLSIFFSTCLSSYYLYVLSIFADLWHYYDFPEYHEIISAAAALPTSQHDSTKTFYSHSDSLKYNQLLLPWNYCYQVTKAVRSSLHLTYDEQYQKQCLFCFTVMILNLPGFIVHSHKQIHHHKAVFKKSIDVKLWLPFTRSLQLYGMKTPKECSLWSFWCTAVCSLQCTSQNAQRFF